MRILLAEDDNDMRRFLVKALENAGYDVASFDNGMSAYNRLREEPFDIVLLDVHMPVMDGKEAIKRMRAAPEAWSKLPVIALTADAMSGDRERYLALGMTDYVSKPLDQRELTSKIAAAMGERELIAGIAA